MRQLPIENELFTHPTFVGVSRQYMLASGTCDGGTNSAANFRSAFSITHCLYVVSGISGFNSVWSINRAASSLVNGICILCFLTKPAYSVVRGLAHKFCPLLPSIIHTIHGQNLCACPRIANPLLIHPLDISSVPRIHFYLIPLIYK